MPDEQVRKIELRVSNQKAYVWDIEDLAVLRSQHHVCGVLFGTLPHLSQQNVFLGVPLVLLPEEVVLLVQNELAVLVDDPTAHRSPSLSQLQSWNSERIADVKAQIAAVEAKEAVGQKANRTMSEEAMRKRKEREEKRAAAARAKALAEGLEDTQPTESTTVAPSAPPLSDPRPSTPTNVAGTSNTAYSVTVPASSATDLPWYESTGAIYPTLQDAKTAGIWSYPSTPFERAKCGVFRDLWAKGHFMGGGIKFGGDFLVYPGDPLRYHSHFVASVLESPTAKIRPMEIVAHGRLGTATKKAHLLCGWDDDRQEASYYSIEWAGFG